MQKKIKNFKTLAATSATTINETSKKLYSDNNATSSSNSTSIRTNTRRLVDNAIESAIDTPATSMLVDTVGLANLAESLAAMQPRTVAALLASSTTSDNNAAVRVSTAVSTTKTSSSIINNNNKKPQLTLKKRKSDAIDDDATKRRLIAATTTTNDRDLPMNLNDDDGSSAILNRPLPVHRYETFSHEEFICRILTIFFVYSDKFFSSKDTVSAKLH